MEKQNELQEINKVLWSIRIFALIIAGIVVYATLTGSWAESVPQMVIMLMALYILVWSFRPLLKRNKALARLLIAAGIVLFSAGLVVFLWFSS